MNGTAYMNLPIEIIIITEGLIGTIFNVTAIVVLFNVHFGTKFTTFVIKAQPIFDLSACLSTAIFHIIEFISPNNGATGIYFIDFIICHFWFRNAFFWLPCILSVQNLVCISFDRVSSVIFIGLHKANSNRFFAFYFVYILLMLLVLYVPTPLLRQYTGSQCVMDFSFPWIHTRVFLDYVVYSWVVFAYFIPVLVMLISHAWIIHVLKISGSPHHSCASQNFETTLQTKRKIHQLVITTAIMSLQQAVLHSFECISQILITNGVVVYTYGTPIEQMGTFLILLGCLSNPCILIFGTSTLRRRLSASIRTFTERMSSVGTSNQLTKSSTQ
ncbi:amine GPCR [Schistosoma japonicum]|uniref:Amine GPCR n=1 Tax=Schistosoma japonicum TaxID=6182 RepID=A0A4Z2CWS3_SCHJA|nr:amine GPCR [Schistosoma japonicum]